ncbi:MAG: hypothetical protein MR296_05740 [Tenericutes bacterium]|nr:hypothetical protein [Mycoplasmatota bacterium]
MINNIKIIKNYVEESLKKNLSSYDSVIKLANLMNYSIVDSFTSFILKQSLNGKKNYVKKEDLYSSLLGIFGNYFARLALLNNYDIKEIYSEKEFLNINGKKAPCDIAFIDNNDETYLVEVKTSRQIIGNVKNYVYINSYNFDGISNDAKKFKLIGDKLIKQVSSLKKISNNVIAFLYSDCMVDDIIKDNLSSLGVKLYIFEDYSIVDIERLATSLIDNVLKDVQSKIKK